MTFIPKGYKIPQEVETDLFLLRPITIHDVIKDHDAVITSQEHLWNRFGEKWGWPSPDLSLEQDLIDLAWHQKEAQIQSSFTYSVMSSDQNLQLGCVYVDPPSVNETDAEVWFWVRTSMLESGFASKLEEFVRKWLKTEWPFNVVNLNDEVVEL